MLILDQVLAREAWRAADNYDDLAWWTRLQVHSVDEGRTNAGEESNCNRGLLLHLTFPVFQGVVSWVERVEIGKLQARPIGISWPNRTGSVKLA